MTLKDRLIRAELLAQQAYPVAESDGFIKLDLMENPYPLPQGLRATLAERLAQTALNRYPLPGYRTLKQALAKNFDVPTGFPLLLGNGSDELIGLLSLACARPGAKVLAPAPSFVMYKLSALFTGMEYVGVPLKADFTLDLPAMLSAIATHRPALIYLAYPNNPTGNLFDAEAIDAILRASRETSLVIVDEAYQPFAQASFMPRLPEHPNLLVMRTVSKLGLAGIRLGYMAAAAEWIDEFEKVRPPFNVNVLTEAAALCILEHADVLEQQAAKMREQRNAQAKNLAALPGVEVFPSAANFLLIRVKNSDHVFAELMNHKILVKNVSKMDALLANCLRISIGLPEENAALLEALAAIL